MAKKRKKRNCTCSDCIHEWACQAWNIGVIHNMDATMCAPRETLKDSNAYFLGRREAEKELEKYKKAVELMAEYIVTLGGVDYHLCDEIPKEIHLKHQPKNDGNYENEPCQKCVAEYFLMKGEADGDQD
ncbi:unknown [Firmicutes bacterium CAG:238]|nr:unknown [Firmicutes bacterium CAG:238]